MDTLLIPPTNTYSLIGLLLFLFTGLVYAFNIIRNNDLKNLRETRKELQENLEIKARDIADLQKTVSELQIKVTELQANNKSLEDLVKLALKDYFTANPAAATTLLNTHQGF